jgi:hypothetical protein
MKSCILLLILAALHINFAFSQEYGWIKIYSDDTSGAGLLNMQTFQTPSGYKDIYIQKGGSISNPQEYGKYLKRDIRTGNNWFVPVNGFLSNERCFCYCPYFCNPPYYVYNITRLLCVSPLDENFVLKTVIGSCGCDAGDIVRYTANGGLNVVSLPQFSNDFIGHQCIGFDFDPINDSIIYLAYPKIGSSIVYLYKSTNRAKTWESISKAPDFSLFVIVNPLKHNYIYVGSYSGLYLSTNYGTSFSRVTNAAIRSLAFCNADSVIYAISNGSVYKSYNHGLTWLYLIDNQFRCIEVSPNNSSYVYAGNLSGLHRSTDGGQSWMLYNDYFYPSKNVIGLLKDPNSGDTIIVGTIDAVYKVWRSFVNIKQLSAEIPSHYKLEQNYPNPFNPVTNIRFSLPKSSNVILKIYNTKGKELMQLLNQYLNAGTYNFMFNADNLPSGVYFYKFETPGFTQSKKMVLLK